MQGVSIKDRVVLVTGSGRGIGTSFVTQALAMGAKKVYATARDTSKLTDLLALNDDRLVTLDLDVTDQEQVSRAAVAASDVEILINNAGLECGGPIFDNAGESAKRQEMEVNYFGTMKMSLAFTPVLKANGGGALVNILSVGALVNAPFAPNYSATKAAAHSLTQAFRALLVKQDTLVVGVYPGPVDTDMAKNIPFPDEDKATPDSVAINVFESLVKAEEDVFPDPISSDVARALKEDAKGVERFHAAMI